MKKGWPRVIVEAILQLLIDFSEESTPTPPSHPQILSAVQSQMEIGIKLLPRGFISKQWLQLLEHFDVKRPRTKITSLLRAIWIDYTDAVWRARNDLLHRQQNEHQQATSLNYTTRLRWFLEHPHVLSPSDSFLLCFTHSDIDTMTDPIKKHTLHHLDIAKQAYALQLLQRKKGQSVLPQFFPLVVDKNLPRGPNQSS